MLKITLWDTLRNSTESFVGKNEKEVAQVVLWHCQARMKNSKELRECFDDARHMFREVFRKERPQ